jgi:hypothetical protein
MQLDGIRTPKPDAAILVERRANRKPARPRHAGANGSRLMLESGSDAPVAQVDRASAF